MKLFPILILTIMLIAFIVMIVMKASYGYWIAYAFLFLNMFCFAFIKGANMK